MHRECERLVGAVVSRNLIPEMLEFFAENREVEANFQSSGVELETLVDRLLPRIEVEECPPDCGAAISTPFPFIAVPILRDMFPSGSAVPEFLRGPSAFAQWIVDHLSSKVGADLTLSVGGGGHVNITPSPVWMDRLLLELGGPDPSVLVDGIATDWNDSEARRESEDRALAAADDEMKEIVQRVRNEDSIANRLMLFGILADPELEVRVFLRGYAGRENLPWYFERARDDLNRQLQIVEGWCGSRHHKAHPDERSSHSSLGSLSEFPNPRGASLLAWQDVLLGYRRAVALTTRRYRPEFLARQLLDLLAAFYRVYQTPQFRNATRVPTSVDEPAFVAALVYATQRQIDAAFELLFESCLNGLPPRS